MLLAFARVWAYPLWCSVTRSESADAVAEDVDWWVRCIGDTELLGLDRYSRFAYLSGALTEFRTLVHYRLRSAPLALRVLLRAAAILFICEVPSCQRHGNPEEVPYPLQDRHFRLSTHSNLGNSARNPG